MNIQNVRGSGGEENSKHRPSKKLNCNLYDVDYGKQCSEMHARQVRFAEDDSDYALASVCRVIKLTNVTICLTPRRGVTIMPNSTNVNSRQLHVTHSRQALHHWYKCLVLTQKPRAMCVHVRMF